MERRGFLKGMFGGVTAAGVIVAASMEDIAAFANPLTRNEPVFLDAPRSSMVDMGEELYNANGEIVALVKNVHIEHIREHSADFTNVAGPLSVRIDVQCVGPIRWKGVQFKDTTLQKGPRK